METRCLKTNTATAQKVVIQQAAALLQEGAVVAFPTETVYGLGADARNEAAVRRIFDAKARPADNPLIVHTASKAQLALVAAAVPQSAVALMNRFWPGPLSIVLPKHKQIPDITTGGLDTVVVRWPAHPIAQALIAAADTPIAAPSANRSGRISPTTAAHVQTDLAGRIPLIIDGGSVAYGLESTVIDCTTTPPIILRPGSITEEDIRQVLPDVITVTTLDTHRSPGMKYRHYAPRAPIILFTGSPQDTTRAMTRYQHEHASKAVACLWHTGNFTATPLQYQLPTEPAAAAPKLFAALRGLDEKTPDVILVQGYANEGVGTAIMNRLEKAASTVVPVPPA